MRLVVVHLLQTLETSFTMTVMGLVVSIFNHYGSLDWLSFVCDNYALFWIYLNLLNILYIFVFILDFFE